MELLLAILLENGIKYTFLEQNLIVPNEPIILIYVKNFREYEML